MNVMSRLRLVSSTMVSGLRLERASILDEALGEPHAACDLYEAILTDEPNTSFWRSVG